MAFLSWFGILSNSRTIGKEAEEKKSGTEGKNNFGKVKKYEKQGENKQNEEWIGREPTSRFQSSITQLNGAHDTWFS